MRAGEPRLLIENDTRVKRERKAGRIDPEGTGLEGNGPSAKDEQNAKIHWIAREAIESNRDQTRRRCPRRKSASAGDVEIPDAPEEEYDPNGDDRNPDHMQVPLG